MYLFVNWLVQGTALTVAVALGLRLHKTLNAATRERVWWMALTAVALMPIVALARTLAIIVQPSTAPAISFSEPLMITVPSISGHAATVASLAWGVWAIVGLTRVALALVRLRRAKQDAAPFPAGRENRLPMWVSRRDVARPATLVLSSCVQHAAVLGLGRPMIAVARDALAHLTSEELDQIVLHEYAHIQRRDDIAVLAQRILVAVTGFHPGIWWLDRALTIDREIACDDWVVAASGARTNYARCLVKLASLGAPSRWEMAPGALRSRSQLTARVTALLDRRREPSTMPSRGTVRVALPAVAFLTLLCVSVSFVGIAPASMVLFSRSITTTVPVIAMQGLSGSVGSHGSRGSRGSRDSGDSPGSNPVNLVNLVSPVIPVSPVSPVNPVIPVNLVNPVNPVNPVKVLLPATVLTQLDLRVEPGAPLNQIGQAAGSPWIATARFFSRAGKSFAERF